MLIDIRSLQSKVGDLQASVRLTKARDAVEDLQTTVNGLGQRVATLRTRGYVFEKDMESQTQNFVDSWALLYPNLQSQINMQSSVLLNSLRPIEMQMPQLNRGCQQSGFCTRVARFNAIRGKNAGRQSLSNRKDHRRDVRPVQQPGLLNSHRHLTEIEYLVKQLAEATFQLLPTEGGIAAIKAVWCKTGKEQKDDPEGVLYLTDQRILFEQKEEIVTKKVLFVATEKQESAAISDGIPCPACGKGGHEQARNAQERRSYRDPFRKWRPGGSGSFPYLAG